MLTSPKLLLLLLLLLLLTSPKPLLLLLLLLVQHCLRLKPCPLHKTALVRLPGCMDNLCKRRCIVMDVTYTR